MKKITGVLLLFVFAVSSNAQNYKIQKAYAFVSSFTPGRAQTDEGGRRMNPGQITERFIYLETNFKGKPEIDSVLYNNELFAGTLSAIKETRYNAGIKKANGQVVIISTKKGNYSWRLDLQKVRGNNLEHKTVKKITIKGRLGKFKFSYALTAETELKTPDRY